MTFGLAPFGGAPFGAAPVVSDPTLQAIDETLAFNGTLVGEVWTLITERLRISATATPFAHVFIAVSDALGFRDTARITMQAVISDSIVLTDALAGDKLVLVAIRDSLRMSATCQNTYSALGTIADTLGLATTLRSVQMGTVDDVTLFGDTLETSIGWYEAMLEDLGLSDTLEGLAAVTIQLTDTMQLADETNATGSFVEAIREELDFALSFSLGDEAYTAYSMNAATKALSSYTNYEFNSLATFGNYTLAAGAAGLYTLGGADDAGTPIVWRVRTGLGTLGTQRMKGLDAAYIGYTATGRIALKCIVVGSSGEKIGYWYELTPRTANAPRPGRIMTGRGLRSVYWGFEMTNIDAGDIELDVLELHPITLEGRLG